MWPPELDNVRLLIVFCNHLGTISIHNWNLFTPRAGARASIEGGQEWTGRDVILKLQDGHFTILRHQDPDNRHPIQDLLDKMLDADVDLNHPGERELLHLESILPGGEPDRTRCMSVAQLHALVAVSPPPSSRSLNSDGRVSLLRPANLSMDSLAPRPLMAEGAAAAVMFPMPAQIDNDARISQHAHRRAEPPKKDSNHAWSVADFELERPHLVGFVRSKILPPLDREQCRIILVRAPVKSGKREIVEYTAQRDYSNDPQRFHVFITALCRIADKNQIQELGLHNVKAFCMKNVPEADKCINWIWERIDKGKNVVLHIDECDFGSGLKQVLGKVWSVFNQHPSVKVILYSATPEEVLFSGQVDEECQDFMRQLSLGVKVQYEPPAGYCGPKRFLEESLVFEAEPFFELVPRGGGIQLTPQGTTIIAALCEAIRENPRRNVLVLRLTGGQGQGKRKKDIYQFLQNASSCVALNGITIVASKEETYGEGGMDDRILNQSIPWSNRNFWDVNLVGNPCIVVIDQTASRSTEFACHDRIFAYHDYRKTKVYATISQAQERVNHYEQKYGGVFQPIRVYGHKLTWQLSAGQIDYDDYGDGNEKQWKVRKVRGKDSYFIKSTADKSVHPDYPQPVSEDAAAAFKKTLGCSGGKVKLADRVTGGIKKERAPPEISYTFHVSAYKRANDFLLIIRSS